MYGYLDQDQFGRNLFDAIKFASGRSHIVRLIEQNIMPDQHAAWHKQVDLLQQQLEKIIQKLDPDDIRRILQDYQ